MSRVLAATLSVFVCVVFALPVVADDAAKLIIPARRHTEKTETKIAADPSTGVTTSVGTTIATPENLTVTIDPKKTAIVVCDMWDKHWCNNATKRCADLALVMEPVLRTARDKGMTIVHAPSNTMGFYKDHPARQRALAAKRVEPPKEKDISSPPPPIDDRKGGCDDEKPANRHRAWSRQTKTLTIDEEKDYITDNGREVYNIFQEKGIDTVLVMGVHTNLCILNRTFAIKQMVKWGVRTFLVRDLTDAMYDPRDKPFVTHDQGTQLVIQYIEKYWCPSIESKSLL